MIAINRAMKVFKKNLKEIKRIENYNTRHREWCPICKKILVEFKCPDKHVDYSDIGRKNKLSAQNRKSKIYHRQKETKDVMFGKVKLSAPRRKYDRFDQEPLTIGDFAFERLMKGEKISCGL